MKLMILDGNSIVNRAFYGVRPLNAPDGTPTNAVFGFLSILRRLLDENKPEALCVAFDLKDPTFRHRAYDGYKATRHPMPEELAAQMPVLKEVLDAMAIRRYELSGYEADDILGTVAAKCDQAGWNCIVVTGDKDSLQLVSDHTTVCNVKTVKGQTETIYYTPERFEQEYGFTSEKMVDLKALMGDSSDNIPGVSGIGEKTAMDLVQRYGTIANIFADLDALDIKKGVYNKLAAGKESAEKSYWLATIFREVPMEFTPGEAKWNGNYTPALYPLFKRLGFQKMMDKWGVKESEDVPATLPESDYVRLSHAEGTGEEKAEALRKALGETDTVALLLETGGDGFELCDGKNVYHLEWSECGEQYAELLQLCTQKSKLSHQVKDQMRELMHEKLSIEDFAFDTALAAYLLDATAGDYSLERLSMKYLGTELSGTEAVWALYPILLKELQTLHMDELYFTAELPLCKVLAHMEQSGFLVDRNALSEFGKSLTADIAELQARIYAEAGHEFNINSPKQLGTVLFEELSLKSGKKTKTGWSTNADVLEKLVGEHPIVSDVLEFRMLTKLKSTYADGLLKVIDPNDNRIHTSFQMTVTATGRLSSTEPNLQNIPIRRSLGARIRSMFVAAPGKVLVDADYSQIELRLLAHISGDKAMQEAFLSGEDFHAVTASKVFGIPLEEVTPVLRSRAKAVNFGIVYGISAFSLAQDISVRPYEAKAYMEAYLDKYHGVRDYMHTVVEQAKADGYVATLYGRRRALPELKSSNFNTRAFGERVALNMPIQGTAADIIKLAMVHVSQRLEREGLQAKLILQVHDELIVECPEGEVELVRAILCEEMQNVASLAVPLTCEAKSGHSWAEAH